MLKLHSGLLTALSLSLLLLRRRLLLRWRRRRRRRRRRRGSLLLRLRLLRLLKLLRLLLLLLLLLLLKHDILMMQLKIILHLIRIDHGSLERNVLRTRRLRLVLSRARARSPVVSPLSRPLAERCRLENRIDRIC